MGISEVDQKMKEEPKPTPNKLGFKEVHRRIALPYAHKVNYAQNIIRGFTEGFEGSLAIACSFGKASLVMLHIAHQFDPNVLVVFSNTLCEYRGIYETRDKLVEEWSLNFQEVRPKKGVNFWSLSRKYGYPAFKIKYSKREHDGKRRPKKGQRRPRCCYHLKEAPAKRFYRNNQIQAVMLGLQASESFNRKMLISRKTCTYFSSEDNCWKYNPLAFWTDEDIWRYIRENEIPYPKEYDHPSGCVTRTGCAYCTAYRGWETQMRIMKPRIYRKIITEMKSKLDYWIA